MDRIRGAPRGGSALSLAARASRVLGVGHGSLKITIKLKRPVWCLYGGPGMGPRPGQASRQLRGGADCGH
eukprot:scaffold104557_cov68-Phaeocystis_antarctica.AAC.2